MENEIQTSNLPVKMGSERSFGLVFTLFFAIVALLPMMHGRSPRLWAFGVAAAILAVVALRPALLKPLNLVWFKFGLLLGKLIEPIVMAILFYGVFTPFGLLLRLLKVKTDIRGCDRNAATYWVARGADQTNMKNQF